MLFCSIYNRHKKRNIRKGGSNDARNRVHHTGSRRHAQSDHRCRDRMVPLGSFTRISRRVQVENQKGGSRQVHPQGSAARERGEHGDRIAAQLCGRGIADLVVSQAARAAIGPL
jgi:hypothetical protein